MIRVILLLAATAAAAPLLSDQLSDQTNEQDAGQMIFGNEGDRLLELAPGVRRWMTEEEMLALKRARVGFFDVTHEDISALSDINVPADELPSGPRAEEMVRPILDRVETKHMKKWLSEFTQFHTRYYRSSSGTKSAEWLFAQISEIASHSKHNISVERFKHPKWPQFSIIARFAPRQRSIDDAVILGAHQDSINLMNPYGRAPGADDDGSGAIGLLEAFRVLASSSDWSNDRPIEFHWYSGEESGLLGSQEVAAAYKKQRRSVYAMIQNDMTGFHRKDDEYMGIVTDYVDPQLTSLVKKYIETYCNLKWRETRCNYGCSDHASWNKANYRSAFPFETIFSDDSPYVHTTKDTIETVDFNHMVQFTKLDVAFAIELSQLQ